MEMYSLIGLKDDVRLRVRVRAQELRASSSVSSSDAWWTLALPSLVKKLLSERARQQQDHAADLEWEASQLAAERAQNQGRANLIDELFAEINDLKDELVRAKGREEALHAVIHRCRWG